MQILVLFQRVLIVVVLITNVERRIREDKIHKRFLYRAEQFDAVPADNLIPKFMHVRIIQTFTAISSGKRTRIDIPGVTFPFFGTLYIQPTNKTDDKVL
jgi:hypothetical protein